MINIVNVKTHCDDNRNITAIEVKLKSIGDISGHPLIATISSSFFQTTFLSDSGNKLQIIPDEDRKDIVDFIVSVKEYDSLSFTDVANFLSAFQKALDETKIF